MSLDRQIEGALAALASDAPPEAAEQKGSSQQTARRAVAVLLSKDAGFHEPSKKERNALLIGFAMRKKVLYGAAFDIVRMREAIDLTDPYEIASKIDALTIYEIKSTNRPSIGPDLRNYFFALSTAELLVAQNLKEQFRFAFVNVITAEYLDLTLQEVFARARGIYPTWSISF